MARQNGSKADTRISFLLAAYDKSQSLTIDPVLVYSTYLGGSGNDEGRGIAVDSAGNAYVTGQTGSPDFPTANPLQGIVGGGDAFVTKISDTAPPLPQPVLTVTPPPSLDFGPVTVGTSSDLTFTVTNTGTGTLIGTASASAPFSIVSGGSFSLAAGASQAVVVRFSPTATGSFTANVSFTSNGGDASQVVTGTGESAPAISVTPTTLAFGSVAVGSSADLTFAVDNSGGGTLSGTCSTNAPFSLPNGCSFNLTSGQTAVVTVRFSLTLSGVFTEQVFFTSNGGDVGVTATGVAAAEPAVVVTVINPTSGSAGTVVTIKGEGFGNVQGSGYVSFGVAQAEVSSWKDRQIKAVVPAIAAATHDVTVTVAGSTSNAVPFTVTVPSDIIELGFPFEQGYWVPTTYDGHGGVGTYNAVDFRYASPQESATFDWVPTVNEPLIPLQNVSAAHSGVLTLERERFYCNTAPPPSDEVVQSTLILTDDKGFATWYAHLETVQPGQWIFVHNTIEDGINLHACADIDCETIRDMPNGTVMRVSSDAVLSDDKTLTWRQLLDDQNKNGIKDDGEENGWAVEALVSNGRQVLLNSLFVAGIKLARSMGP